MDEATSVGSGTTGVTSLGTGTTGATPGVTIGQRIDRQYAALSPQEQRAADVVLDRLDDLAVFNASEIAQLSGVSKATVSRLVRRLGYEDFAQVRAQAKLLRGLGRAARRRTRTTSRRGRADLRPTRPDSERRAHARC